MVQLRERQVYYSSNAEERIYVRKKMKNSKYLILNFIYNEEWITKIKQITSRKYDPATRGWEVPYSIDSLRQLFIHFPRELFFDFNWKEDFPEFVPPSIKIPSHNFYSSKQIKIKELSSSKLEVFVSPDKKGWINIIRSVPGRQWQKERRCWVIPYVKESLDILSQINKKNLNYTFKIKNDIPEQLKRYQYPIPQNKNFKHLNQYQKNAVKAIEEQLLLERKSWRTIKSYKAQFIEFITKFKGVKPSQITAEQIKKYLNYKIREEGISESTQNQIINALKVFYCRILHQDKKIEKIPRPKLAKNLPNVFSKKEVAELINSIANLKHKTIVCITYSAGLRKSELINLRVRDVLINRNCIFVKGGKGKKDRYVMLAPTAAKMIKAYKKEYSPKYWLIEGKYGGQYSESSFQELFTLAKKKAMVNPYVTIHGLRHSFATHLLERGVPLNVIKEMLGHEHIKTTEVYLHLSNTYINTIHSPLEDLDID